MEEGEAALDEINEKEKSFIILFDAKNPDKGYNLNDGGKSMPENANKAAIAWMQAHPEFGLARAADMLKWQAEHPEEAAVYRKEN